MKTRNLDLSVTNQEKEYPAPTYAQIYVKTCTHDAKGVIYITPMCVTLSEIEAQCDRLITEIKSIRKKARGDFACK